MVSIYRHKHLVEMKILYLQQDVRQDQPLTVNARDRNVFSCFTFDLERKKLDVKLYIQTLNDLANHASEIMNLIARNRPNCYPVHMPACTPLYRLPLSQSDCTILYVFQSVLQSVYNKTIY